MAPEPLLVIGAGGFGRETLEVVRAVNAAHRADSGHDRWDVVGVLDDDEARWGTAVGTTRIVGPVDAVADHPGACAVVCTGSPRNFTSKAAIVRRLSGRGGGPAYATLVHPAAVLPPSCLLGEGTVVLAGVVATADVVVGDHVGLMPHVVLTHDDVLADFVTAGAGARLAGGVTVAAGAYLGAGCTVREGVRIGAGALVAMGAVVLQDVPPRQVWAGVPAAFLRSVDVPREVPSP
jgi:sugar O-acyltransferase (sialic acid O-acetyltransferase NeuD family)